MRKLLLLVPVLCVTVSLVAAQGGQKAADQKAAAPAAGMKIMTSWKCQAPNPPPTMVPVPDMANHMYGVDQFTCTATKGEIEGVKQKDGGGTEFTEARGTSVSGHGVFVETLANGDKVTYNYTFKGTMTADNKMQSGSNSWTIAGGTGKFKGMTGKGTCAGKGNPDGSANYECTGTYSMTK